MATIYFSLLSRTSYIVFFLLLFGQMLKTSASDHEELSMVTYTVYFING